MQTRLEVEDAKEAVIIKAALEDKELRALVKVAGALMLLPSDRARQRVLRFAVDALDEGV